MVQDCSVCARPLRTGREVGQEVIALETCGHLFHYGCIFTWMTDGSGDNSCCPLCRGLISGPASLLRTANIAALRNESRVDQRRSGGPRVTTAFLVTSHTSMDAARRALRNIRRGAVVIVFFRGVDSFAHAMELLPMVADGQCGVIYIAFMGRATAQAPVMPPELTQLLVRMMQRNRLQQIDILSAELSDATLLVAARNAVRSYGMSLILSPNLVGSNELLNLVSIDNIGPIVLTLVVHGCATQEVVNYLQQLALRIAASRMLVFNFADEPVPDALLNSAAPQTYTVERVTVNNVLNFSVRGGTLGEAARTLALTWIQRRQPASGGALGGAL